MLLNTLLQRGIPFRGVLGGRTLVQTLQTKHVDNEAIRNATGAYQSDQQVAAGRCASPNGHPPLPIPMVRIIFEGHRDPRQNVFLCLCLLHM